MASEFSNLPVLIHEMKNNFGKALSVVKVSELEEEKLIFVQDGNHGEYRPLQDEFVESGVPFVRPPNLVNGRIDFDTCQKINGVAFSRVRKGIGKGGDIILTHNATIGRVAITEDSAPVFVTNPQTTVWRSLNRDFLDNNYLYFFMKSAGFQEQLLSHTGRNATFDYVSLTKQRSLNIPILPILIQKSIGKTLRTIDDKAALNRQMNETLEAMAQTLFKSWFVDFDPVIDNALVAGKPIPDEWLERAEQRQAVLNSSKTNQAIRDLFPDEFEFTEEMGWVPKGWTINDVESVIDINPRTSLKKGAVAAYADMKALPESGYSIDGVIEKAYSGGTKFKNRDVLFARITPCLENGKTGLVDFLEPEEVGFGSTEFIVMREKDNIKMGFIACLARNDKFRLHAQQSMVGSSGRQRVQNACFSSFYLALPCDDGKLLKLFDGMIEASFTKISKQSQESRILAKLRDTLLPKLLSGELRIPDAAALIDKD